jgi:hypothetical protein
MVDVSAVRKEWPLLGGGIAAESSAPASSASAVGPSLNGEELRSNLMNSDKGRLQSVRRYACDTPFIPSEVGRTTTVTSSGLIRVIVFHQM